MVPEALPPVQPENTACHHIQAAHVSPAPGGTVHVEPWPDDDPEPGAATCPTCGRALFPPTASAVLDLLVTAHEALWTAHEAIGTLKAVVERAVVLP